MSYHLVKQLVTQPIFSDSVVDNLALCEDLRRLEWIAQLSSEIESKIIVKL